MRYTNEYQPPRRHRRCLSLAASLTVLGLTLAVNVRGGPPFVTDDPEPVDYHNWEFYVASQDSKYRGDWSGSAPEFELNYGVLPNVQLHVITPLGFDVPPQGSSHYGLNDLELGVKFRFIQETNGQPQVGIYPMVDVPTGDAAENLGNGRWDGFLPVWLQKSWGSWTAYGGGGYGINSFTKGNENWGFVGAVLQKQVLPNVFVGGEIFYQSALQTDFPYEGTEFNLGTGIDVTPHQHLLFSAGRSIGGHVDFQCYIAYQFTFDNSLLRSWFNPRH